ncbi:DUF262 domain-containing protein [Massilia arenae]|uniref:DUF262 domain-containing protein n=1 Tax=Massilia arenae TaxID=2603288 RepID=A0A5C7G2F8_9BURK|nr:DUF262 domain-containing protein [Massilia arenae]TXF97438.1 DUF262 domain-containing protein [Massilia arenae]
MKMEDAIQRAVTLLSLDEIACWQVAELPGALQRGASLGAALPALQRGAVWRPVQTEALWDSIIRGFPIGSIMLMPFESALGQQDMLLASARTADPTHMLLDGQQRATAVALGFYAPWNAQAAGGAPASLWLDLGAAPSSERDFSFRLVTRAHPWGYPASGERQRLALNQMREADRAFREAQSAAVWHRRPPVEAGWPWDSVAPVPVAALLEASVGGGDGAALAAVLDRMLPHWRLIRTHVSGTGVLEELVQSTSVTDLLARVRQTRERYCVPAQTIPSLLQHGPVAADDDAMRPDPTETLFVRLNSGGTPLQGEDLIYSIAKAIWPSAPDLIKRIRNRFFSEARATLLIARLATVEAGQKEAPAAPDVGRFRRLVHGVGSALFRERMEQYLQHQAAPLFEQAHALLTGRDFGLPTVLAAELARGDSGRDIMFLLLRWIERLNAAGFLIDGLKATQRARAIGALTAISWFARKPDRCVRVLWERLAATAPDDLPEFFCRKNLGHCLRPIRNEAPLLCLPPPSAIRAQFSARITQPRGSGDGAFSNPASGFWTNWSWERFVNQIHGDLGDWYAQALPHPQEDSGELQPIETRTIEDWRDLANTLYYARSLVLFAQRKSLSEWFTDFDPTDPDSMDEMNRPWDMDHILPSYYLEKRHGIPQIIREWHGSIGNLRAWPLDANRSDAEMVPMRKLSDVGETTQAYGMATGEALREASFIAEVDWKYWETCTPDPSSSFSGRYLALPREHGECRKAMIKAVTNRVLALYEEWYGQLKIAQLMPTCSVRGR